MLNTLQGRRRSTFGCHVAKPILEVGAHSRRRGPNFCFLRHPAALVWIALLDAAIALWELKLLKHHEMLFLQPLFAKRSHLCRELGLLPHIP